MPFEGAHANDIGLETAEGPVCIHDSENGKVKSAEQIFEGGVQFFLQYTSGVRALAERLTRKNMNHLDYWHKHQSAVLEGEQATNAEYHTILAKL